MFGEFDRQQSSGWVVIFTALWTLFTVVLAVWLVWKSVTAFNEADYYSAFYFLLWVLILQRKS